VVVRLQNRATTNFCIFAKEIYRKMPKIVIALDGHSGCGKSSTAKALAECLQYAYIDTGAMYRAVTLYLLRNQIDLTDNQEISEHLPYLRIRFQRNPKTGINETFLNDENVESEIRMMRVSENVSQVSSLAEVRHFLVAQQQAAGKEKAVILDGRDIGTVVFPNAELKIFMTADVQIRAERRQKELAEKGQRVDLEEITKNFEQRDFMDANRKESPLRKAKDAITINTTYLTFEEQVNEIVKLAKQKIQEV